MKCFFNPHLALFGFTFAKHESEVQVYLLGSTFINGYYTWAYAVSTTKGFLSVPAELCHGERGKSVRTVNGL